VIHFAILFGFAEGTEMQKWHFTFDL